MNVSNRLDRRATMKAAIAVSVPYFVPSSALGGSGRVGANDRIEIAVVGVGVRGKYLIGNLPNECRVTALCDCSLDQVETAVRPKKEFAKLLEPFTSGDAKCCRVYQDYRELFAQHDADAAIVATPDHHHALAAILAMQAGYDVYVEKPLALTIAGGRAIVEAKDRYKRIVQVGSQQRTMQINRDACEFIRGGGLGKISLVEDRNFPGPMPYEAAAFPRQPIPDSLQWDLFCGQTPRRAYNRNLWMKDAYKFGYLTWRGWDLFEDYSGHLMTNWGAHSVDMIQYALGMDDSGPIEIIPDVEAVNDRTDDQWHEKTPPLGTLADKRRDKLRFSPVTMKYAGGIEVAFKPGITETVFHGDRGKLWMRRNGYRTEPKGMLPEPDPVEEAKWAGVGIVAKPHLENWLAAIRTRGDVNAPVEIGHRSASACHLANMARKLNRRLRWNPKSEMFVDDAEADSMLSRIARPGFEITLDPVTES